MFSTAYNYDMNDQIQKTDFRSIRYNTTSVQKEISQFKFRTGAKGFRHAYDDNQAYLNFINIHAT